MYKIFFNNRAICIGDSKEGGSFNGKIHRWQTSDTVQKIIADFEEQTEDIFILTEYKEALLEQFKAEYQYIKAAGGVVYNRQQQVLAIFRLGKWDLPKGKVEDNETVNQAAIREVEEECGITNVVIEKPLTVTYHTYTMFGKKWLKETHWYSMFYNGNETVTPQTEEDIERVEWLDASQLETFKRNTYSSILEVLKMV